MSTGNVDRIKFELEKAVAGLPERVPGYRAELVTAAIDCITTAAEHDDRKTNINQRFDGCLEALAKALGSQAAEAQQ